MSKFRSKVVEIDAIQWTGENYKEVFEWRGQWEPGAPQWRGTMGALLIPTLEDVNATHHAASPGDWIIRGLRGEYYPCKPDIFAMKYEAVP